MNDQGLDAPYFDGRAAKSMHPDTLTQAEVEVLPERRVTFETVELYAVDSAMTTTTTKRGICINAPEYLYPRRATVELARELYLAGELSEREFEHALGQALEWEGVQWGEPEVDA